MDAHDQSVTHKYVIHYPSHEPRVDDPHYIDFNRYHRLTRPTARCSIGIRYNDFSTCKDAQGNPVTINPQGEMSGLELHHSHIEFAVMNAVDLSLLEKDYPGISNPNEVGAWVESAANLMWLCVFHHRGHAGAHTASASDYEAEQYIKNLIQ